jgi:hypothetical protein
LTVPRGFVRCLSIERASGLFNALSERDGASGAVKDVFSLSERSPV